MQRPHTPIALIILDGWGYSENPQHNAIASAHTPNWDHFWQTYPHTLIEGSGHAVGLPDGQMGNSEVGHLNMGAGRVVYQDFTRITKAIEDGDFFSHPVLVNAVQQAVKQDKAVHILGLLSAGGVHSHEEHILAMLTLAAQQGARQIYLHAFLDGRDTPPKSATAALQRVEKKCVELQVGQIASIIGRYYAMDRDQRWERVEKAYELLTRGQAAFQAETALEGLSAAYARGETDEFVQATCIHSVSEPAIKIADGDAVIFMNYRADRARELSRAFTEKSFAHFSRKSVPQLAAFVSLTQYADDIQATVAFTPQSLHNVLGEHLAAQGLRQLRIAETEKYAHVTFFFNGGREEPFANETRLLIPSPKVATYDLQPEMSAVTLTEQLVNAIKSQQFEVIICNFANPDMVGHTGDFAATVKAIESIDSCLGNIIAALQKAGGEAIITADHGNAECMFDESTRQPHTAHTSYPVPFLYIGRPAKMPLQDGALADVAPSLLTLLNLPIPAEMTGRSLIQLI